MIVIRTERVGATRELAQNQGDRALKDIIHLFGFNMPLIRQDDIVKYGEWVETVLYFEEGTNQQSIAQALRTGFPGSEVKEQ